MVHRPLTTLRHCTLFCAVLAILVHLVPWRITSVSSSGLQLLLGRPLFLFPCWFQVRVWRVMLNAHFLRYVQSVFTTPYHIMCLATGSCPVLANRFSFHIFSSHCTLQMCLRQVFMSQSSVVSSVLSVMSYVHRAEVPSSWNCRCGFWSCFDCSTCLDIPEHDKGWSCPAYLTRGISVCTSVEASGVAR